MSGINIGNLQTDEDVQIGKINIPVITPKRGIDYWTPQDKQEVVDEAINAVNAVVVPQEQTRQNNEVTRQNNETTRQNNEATRQENEIARETRFAEYEAIIDGVEDDLEEMQGDVSDIQSDISDIQEEQTTQNTNISANASSITNLQNTKADKTEIPTKTSDLTNDSGFINKNVNDLVNYTLKTNTGSLIDLEINGTTYVITLSLKDVDGNVISTDTIDLPLESVVVGGSYDAVNKKIVLTLENGNTVDIPVGDLIAGLQTEITSQNKLASDLVDDTNSGNKFVTTSEKQAWNGKYDKPVGGIPSTDLDSSVQTSLDKADNAMQSLQNITWSELKQLRDNNQLLIGRQYRITDYTTTTATANTNSAGHRFDIIVQAIGTGELSEQAQAAKNTNETYYANRNLGAWEVKYCLDNDTNRFAWADTTNGKGVIYYLKDEYNNKCGYDHTNIRYKGSSLYGYSEIPSGKITGDDYYYTFAKGTNDVIALGLKCTENIVENYVLNNILQLSKTCFIINGTEITNNQVLSGSREITLVSQTNCSNNIFDIDCYSNLIVSTSSSITGNRFYIQCYRNVIKAGSVLQNAFNYNVTNNKIIVTKSFGSNTFEQLVINNTFNISDTLSQNNLKNQVNDLTITCTRMSWGTLDRTGYINFNYAGYLFYLSMHNVNGTSASKKMDITSSTLTTITAPKNMTTDATGNIICTWVSDRSIQAGIYKTSATDTTWKDIDFS